MWLQWCIYIIVEETITVHRENNRATDGYDTNLILQNNALFINCILKINNVLIENAEHLNIVMPMNNLINIAKITQKPLVLYGTITKIFRLIQ